MPIFEYLELTLTNNVMHLQLARPNKANAMNKKMWFEIGEAYHWINQQSNIHVVVLSGKGKQFSSGADINFLLQVMESTEDCSDDKTEHLQSEISKMQRAFSAIVDCSVPTIAAIHELERNAFRYSVMNAVETAVNKSVELGQIDKIKQVPQEK